MSEFQRFCSAVDLWLTDPAVLDPALAAVADLLARRDPSSGPWFECEVRYLAAHAEDLHAVLGAATLLELWQTSVASR
jgi:hypothetical protein